MKTQTLIRILVADSYTGLKFDRSIALAMTSGTLVAGVIFFLEAGFRRDIASAMETFRFLFKFAVTGSLATVAVAAILRAGRPGASFGRLGWALAISPTLLISAVLVELAVVPQFLWIPRIIGTNARSCVTLIPILAMGPLAFLMLALRHGAPTRPGLAGAIAGLAASGIATTLYASNCTDDSPLFVLAWYPLAIGLVVLIGFLGGLRFLRW